MMRTIIFLILISISATTLLAKENSYADSVVLSEKEYKIDEILIEARHIIIESEIFNEKVSLNKFLIDRIGGSSISRTMDLLPNFSYRSLGSATNRPVFRGQHSDRIIITENNIPINDLSSTSADHAISNEISGIENITILNGAEMLRFSGITSGVVLNIHTYENTQSYNSNSVNTSAGYETVNNSKYIFAAGTYSLYEFLTIPSYIRLKYAHRNNNDLKTPQEIINNTGAKSNNFELISAYLLGKSEFTLNFNLYENDYGVPGGVVGTHPLGADIEMFRRNLAAKYEYNFDESNDFEINFANSFYKHIEYEKSGAVGVEFIKKNTYTELSYQSHSNWFKRLGSGVSYNQLSATGFVFTPTTNNLQYFAYYLNEHSLSQFTFDYGLRYELSSFRPDKNFRGSRIETIERDFYHLTASFRVAYNFLNNIYIGLKLANTNKTPTIEELYSNGPHLASYTYEVGNPNLKTEQGLIYELFGAYNNTRFTTLLKLFYYDFSSFIQYSNRGDTNWSHILPIYESTNVPAEFYGFEFQTEFKIGKFVTVKNNCAYTIANNLIQNTPLPRIPPFQNNFELSYIRNGFLSGLTINSALKQNRIAKYEESTAGYTTIGIYIGYIFKNGGLHNINFGIDNLTNIKYYNHLSLIKSILPESGINFKFNYSYSFSKLK